MSPVRSKSRAKFIPKRPQHDEAEMKILLEIAPYLYSLCSYNTKISWLFPDLDKTLSETNWKKEYGIHVEYMLCEYQHQNDLTELVRIRGITL